jgi:hypothetical protein
MNTEYLDYWDNVSRLQRTINDCVKEHYVPDHLYIAPYLAMVQSSGHGKSRLLIELGLRQPVIYISLGAGNCFPPGYEDMRSFFQSIQTVQDMVGLLCFIYTSAIKNLLELHQDPQNSEKSSTELLALFMDKQSINSKSKVSSIYDPVVLKDRKNLPSKDSLISQLNKLAEAFPEWEIITFVVDEAKILLEKANAYDTTFQLFRRALNDIEKAVNATMPKMFAILSDTSSKVSNFAPPGKLDSSNRKIDSDYEGFKLHHPFFEINSTDVHLMKINDEIVKNQSNRLTEDEYFRYQTFFKLGRCLWFIALGRETRKESIIVDSIRYGTTKILGMTKSEFENLSIKPKEAILAALNIRVPLTLSRSGQLSDDMVASYMNTVSSISENREVGVFGSYLSEPLLAFAASQLSRGTKEFHPENLLDVLQELIVLGLVDTGDLGEQLLALIYIMARDECAFEFQMAECAAERKPHPDKHPLIKVKDLLNMVNPLILSSLKDTEDFLDREKELETARIQRQVKKQKTASNQADTQAKVDAYITKLKANMPARSDNLDLLLDGEVSFCQFLDTETTPNKIDLRESFYRGCAIMCVTNQAGVDLIIPVRIKKTGIRKCLADNAKVAKAAVYEDADNTLQKKLSDEVIFDDATMDKLEMAYNFKVTDIIDLKDDYEFTAICIQSKNRGDEDDYGIDTFYPGVIDENKAVPCISIKHVLRSHCSEIDHMSYQNKPYRHGAIMKGLFLHDALRSRESSRFKTVFTDRFLNKAQEILETKPNAYIHIPRMDSTMASAGHRRFLARVSTKFFENLRKKKISQQTNKSST